MRDCSPAAARRAWRSRSIRSPPFSTPTASWISRRRPRRVEFAALAAQARIVHVIGTTGLAPEDLTRIGAAARHATIVRSGNMSLGVNLLAALTRRVARALGEDFDIEIVEMHHRMKVDAPSGTALLLGEAAAEGRGVDLGARSTRVRDGHTGARQTRRYRLRLVARRHGRRRSQRDFRGRRRAHRTHPSRRGSRCLRARRGEGGAVGAWPQGRPLFDGRRAGPQRSLIERGNKKPRFDCSNRGEICRNLSAVAGQLQQRGEDIDEVEIEPESAEHRLLLRHFIAVAGKIAAP